VARGWIGSGRFMVKRTVVCIRWHRYLFLSIEAQNSPPRRPVVGIALSGAARSVFPISECCGIWRSIAFPSIESPEPVWEACSAGYMRPDTVLQT
jgi:hypothetical protein